MTLTARDLAERLPEQRRELLARWLAGAIRPRPAGTAPPPSFAQTRMWFLDRYTPETATYTMWIPLRIHGPLNHEALTGALRAVVARHESLRMRYPVDADGAPMVEVADEPEVPITVLDLRGGSHGDRERRARAAVEADVARPFDLATGPPLRALLVTLAPQDHIFCLSVHHIATDGWSNDLLMSQFWDAYATLVEGGVPQSAPPTVGYGDFAAWQRAWAQTDRARDNLAYWSRQLAGIPPLALPTDRPYPATQTSSGASHTFQLDASLAAAVEAAGRAHRATPFMTLLAALQALLSRYCGQTDFGIGSPIAGRSRQETESMVGLLVNTLVFRADVSGDPTFAELLGRVRQTAIEAYAHQDLSFAHLVSELRVARDVRRPPVFQVHFSMLNWTVPGAGPAAEGSPGAAHERVGLRVGGFDVDNPRTRHELALYVRPNDDGLWVHVTYNTDLFDHASIEALCGRFETLLREVCADPRRRLSDVDLVGEEEPARLYRWADGGGTPPATTIVDLVARWVRDTPHAPAVVHGATTLTFQDLDRRARQWAHRLGRQRADGIVGICLPQSPELAAAVLGVLYAGAAYLPLDPELPPARLSFMLADAGVRTLIADETAARRFDGFTGSIVEPGGEAGEPCGGEGPDPDDLAYVIYTSGSTGVPKGVAVAHRQLANYLCGVAERLGVTPGAHFGLLQSLSFDFSVTMFHLALATGGTVHLLSRRTSGPDLAAYLAHNGIDYLKLTPSHLAALAAETGGGAAALLPRRAMVLGGEASAAAWTAELAGLGDTAIVNHYGPTETTVGVTTYRVPADGALPTSVSTPIGKPLPYAQVHVLDSAMRPVPTGWVGELYIGGDRLARGYLGRPALTAERFVPNPFGGSAGGRLYRTGDLARWLPDGRLEFLGRRDQQLKVRGYRLEPAEVELALAKLPGVAQAVVVPWRDRLVAYLERARAASDTRETAPGADLDITDVRRLLADTLPEYFLPARAVWLDRLPLQAHGKVDRHALPEPTDERPDQAAAYREPRGPVEEAIARVWQRVLGVSRVGVDDDFFDLGGHSLLVTQVVSQLRRELPSGLRPVAVMDLFSHPTVAALARLVTVAAPDAPAALLHELTAPADPAGTVLSLVCVPYGGATGAVFKPLAQALPEGRRLFAVTPPGNDIGTLSTADGYDIAGVAERCVAEIVDRVTGPIAVYGHCGPGGALAVEVARRLERAGRPPVAVYLGGVFPFARPPGLLGRVGKALRLDRWRSDTVYANWLQATGADVGGLEAAERRHLIRAMRRDAEQAEDYYTDLVASGAEPLAAPIVCVVGERDPGTEFYQERYREWGVLTGRTALVVLDEAGHYFPRYRAEELAQIVTTVHEGLPSAASEPPAPTPPDAHWWLEAASVHGPGEPAAAAKREVRPSMGRFLAVAAGQLVANVGAALTAFAMPLWALLDTGSLLRFALFALVGTLPGVLVAPLAGALVDRADRRRTLVAATLAAGASQGALALLVWTGHVTTWLLYGLLALLSVAAAFQRLAFTSAVPKLVPKHYLGNANGVVQLALGLANFLVPLIAVGMLASIGLVGILTVEVVAYLVAIAVLLAVRFPATMATRRRESVPQEIRNGFEYFWRRPGLRAMLLFFVATNLFLAIVLVLVSPLVLTIGDVHDAARVATAATAGAVVAGLLMALWGGPVRWRMRGLLVSAAAYGLCAVVVGLLPDLTLIAFGAIGMSFTLVIVNGIWLTIIHTKVPHRFHARVIALNQMVAQSVVSAGFIVAPLAGAWLEPMMLPGGDLAGSVGALVGTGPGRGIALLYLVCGLSIAVLAALSLYRTALSRFDVTVPDAEPDDLVGLAALRARTTRPTRP
jgi:amino acid adenylation domain-containing protein